MVSYLERSVNSTCVPDPAYLDSVSRPVSRNWNRYVFAFFLVLFEDTEFCKHTVRSRLPRQRHLRTDALVGVRDWPRFPSLNQSLKIFLNKHLCLAYRRSYSVTKLSFYLHAIKPFLWVKRIFQSICIYANTGHGPHCVRLVCVLGARLSRQGLPLFLTHFVVRARLLLQIKRKYFVF